MDITERCRHIFFHVYILVGFKLFCEIMAFGNGNPPPSFFIYIYNSNIFVEFVCHINLPPLDRPTPPILTQGLQLMSSNSPPPSYPNTNRFYVYILIISTHPRLPPPLLLLVAPRWDVVRPIYSLFWNFSSYILDLSLFALGRKIMYIWYTQPFPRQGAILFLLCTKTFCLSFPYPRDWDKITNKKIPYMMFSK